MAPLPVGCELDFVDSEKIDFPLKRHRFDRTDKVAGGRREDLFLASDECDVTRTLYLHNTVIDLTSEQTQGQADHAGRVSHHPLNREMSFSGVGGAEHSRNAAALGEAIAHTV
ncbi:MAG: hypothetical protein RLO15_07525 [Parvibaculum sp.]